MTLLTVRFDSIGIRHGLIVSNQIQSGARCAMASSDNSATTLNDKFKQVQREILPIPDKPYPGFVAMTPGTRIRSSRPSNRCGRRRAHRTFLSFCSMTSALERPAYLAVPVGLPPPNVWLPMDCATRDSTPQRFVPRRARQCFPDAITTRSGCPVAQS